VPSRHPRVKFRGMLLEQFVSAQPEWLQLLLTRRTPTSEAIEPFLFSTYPAIGGSGEQIKNFRVRIESRG
jgi:hypothetical protein